MKVAILGAGLIGGSIGLALRTRGVAGEVTGYDPNPSAARAAVDRGAVSRLANSIGEAVSGSDLVFVAAPVSQIVPLVVKVQQHAPGATLTDVGSTKLSITLDVGSRAEDPSRFVGGHPMAGSEEAGIAAARADLFEGANWILTPTLGTSSDAYGTVQGAVSALGAKVTALEPGVHDSLMALVSHVPQLVASTLMDLASDATSEQPGWLNLAGKGFRDVTRIAASDPGIWGDICEQNADAITARLDELASRLTDLSGRLRGREAEAVGALLRRGQVARRALRDKPVEGEMVELVVTIPDRPGVLAQVTTTIGNLGLNIEDLSIAHGPDGKRGFLSVVIAGRAGAEAAMNALSSGGLIVEAIQ